MSAKSMRFHDLARYKMFAGVNMLADAVKAAPTTEAMVAEEKEEAHAGGNGMGDMPHGMGR